MCQTVHIAGGRRRVGLQRSRRGIISMASEAQKAAWRRYEQKKRLPRKDDRERGKRDRTRDQQARRARKKAAAIAERAQEAAAASATTPASDSAATALDVPDAALEMGVEQHKQRGIAGAAAHEEPLSAGKEAALLEEIRQLRAQLAAAAPAKGLPRPAPSRGAMAAAAAGAGPAVAARARGAAPLGPPPSRAPRLAGAACASRPRAACALVLPLCEIRDGRRPSEVFGEDATVTVLAARRRSRVGT